MTTTRRIDLGAAPGWQALAHAHREAMVETFDVRQRVARGEVPNIEPGDPQHDSESVEAFFARRAAEEAWERDERECKD